MGHRARGARASRRRRHRLRGHRRPPAGGPARPRRARRRGDPGSGRSCGTGRLVPALDPSGRRPPPGPRGRDRPRPAGRGHRRRAPGPDVRAGPRRAVDRRPAVRRCRIARGAGRAGPTAGRSTGVLVMAWRDEDVPVATGRPWRPWPRRPPSGSRSSGCRRRPSTRSSSASGRRPCPRPRAPASGRRRRGCRCTSSKRWRPERSRRPARWPSRRGCGPSCAPGSIHRRDGRPGAGRRGDHRPDLRCRDRPSRQRPVRGRDGRRHRPAGRAAIVREGPAGYDFAHGALRDLVDEGIGLARRRLLHQRVAEALRLDLGGLGRDDLGRRTGIAIHEREAGRTAEAAEAYATAASRAADVFANRPSSSTPRPPWRSGIPMPCTCTRSSAGRGPDWATTPVP